MCRSVTPTRRSGLPNVVSVAGDPSRVTNSVVADVVVISTEAACRQPLGYAARRAGRKACQHGAMESVTSPGHATGDAEGWDLRPMALDDVEAAMAVVEAADAAQAEAGQLPPRTPPSDAQLEASREGHARFVQHDGPGAWVAVSEGQVVGVAESVRRESFWGLSMLFVHPAFQSRGVGGRLLDAAMGYAGGATQRMIQSSSDPRAMRRYFLAGLAMHPTAEMGGEPDRRAIPPSQPGRDGDEEDLELAAAAARPEDVAPRSPPSPPPACRLASDSASADFLELTGLRPQWRCRSRQLSHGAAIPQVLGVVGNPATLLLVVKPLFVANSGQNSDESLG